MFRRTKAPTPPHRMRTWTDGAHECTHTKHGMPPHTHTTTPPKHAKHAQTHMPALAPKGGRERGSEPLSCMGSDPNFASCRAARAALATTFCFDQPRTKPTQNDRNACFICIGLHFRVFSGIPIGEIAPSVAEIRCFERLSRVMHHAWHSVGLSRLMINPLAGNMHCDHAIRSPCRFIMHAHF